MLKNTVAAFAIAGPVFGFDLLSCSVLAPNLNRTPRASFSYVLDQDLVARFVSHSCDPDPKGGGITGYTWDFGDGVIDTLSGPQPTHRYRKTNSYFVVLTVVDTDHATDSIKREIVVSNVDRAQSFDVYPPDQKGCP